MDEYIRRYAGQDLKRRVSIVFVACGPGDHVVRGYYTLNAASFRGDDLPPAQARKVPHYPVPAAIIGRLAVDRTVRGQRVAEYLLMDCFERILQASQLIAVHAIVADAKDEKANAFHERYGFMSFVDQPLRLFITMGTVEQLRNRSPKQK